MVGSLVGARVLDLGIPGEFSGPVDYQIPNREHMIYGGLLADEVHRIPLDADIVTLYIGTNDMWLAHLRTQPDLSNVERAYEDAAEAYSANLRAIVASIRDRVPHAMLVIADVPNPANRPVEVSRPNPRVRTAESWLANSMKASIVSTGAIIVDLECDPAMYDDANFGSPYDVHPVASGFSAIATDFAQAISSGVSQARTCRYQAPI